MTKIKKVTKKVAKKRQEMARCDPKCPKNVLRLAKKKTKNCQKKVAAAANVVEKEKNYAEMAESGPKC